MSTAAPLQDSMLNPRATCPGYTGGQYSMVRAFVALLLGLYLLRMLHMLTLPGATMPFDGGAPWIVSVLPGVFVLTGTSLQAVVVVLVASIGLCMLLGIGWFDRVAAALLWYVLASMHMYGSIRWLQDSIVFIGWALLAHVLIGGLPYGSWKGRGQTDPRGGWAMPRVVCATCWFMLAVGYVLQSIQQVTHDAWLDGRVLSGVLPTMPPAALMAVACVVSAVGLLFPAIALVRRARPMLWAWTLIVHQALLMSTMFHRTNLGMIMLHVLCFDPSWIPPRKAAGIDTVFFDGQCGLCHRMVRLALAEDVVGNLRFAPLHGETFERTLSEQQRTNLPDSVVVYTAEGRMLTHSAAVIRIMQRLGGLWVILADVVGLVPRVMRDPAYRLVAKIRYRLFGSAKQACPLMPPELRERFQF